MKRFLLLITVVLLLVLLCAVSVSAAETEQIRTGLVPALRLDPVTPEDPVKEVFKTKEEAAAHIREHLKARDEKFSVHYQSEDFVRREDLEDLMAEALKHTGNPKEGDYLSWQLAEWRCQTKENYYGEYEIFFWVEYYTTVEQEAELDTAVAKALKELNVDKKSHYEKISAVYDYICKNVTYDYEHLEDPEYMRKHTAYAAMMDKTAVCQGYALLMYRMLLELGVENRLVVGVSGNENHAWNIVEIDGLHYNLDSTWDAGQTEYQYFLRCEENFENHVRYLEYETFDFHDRHPMGAADYKPGTKGKVDPVIAGGSCGESAVWELKRDGSLTITGTGAISDFAYLSGDRGQMAPWEYWEAEIKKVTVGEGITRLGDCSFCEMAVLESVSLPDSLREIGTFVFAHAERLKEITIPDGVTVLGENIFRECDALTEIVIPDSVTEMGSICFYMCKGLKTVRLSKNLKKIPLGAFGYCESLVSVTIPDGVTAIETEAFKECVNLKKLTVPASVTEIGWLAFGRCSSLTEIVFEGSPVLPDRLFNDFQPPERKIRFLGDAPNFHENLFIEANATCYYPKDNATWTNVVKKDWYGVNAWVATCSDEHKAVKDKAVAPTCTKTGLTEGSHCSACGMVLTPQETVPAAGHKPVVDPGRAPGCTEEGLTDGKHCSVCNVVLAAQEKIPATGHTEVVDEPKEPTCEEDGLTEGKRCSGCGEVFVPQETIPALGHALGEWEIVKEATETEEGSQERACSVCDFVEEKKIDKLPPTQTTPPTTAVTTQPPTAAATQPMPSAPGGDAQPSGGVWILVAVLAVLGAGGAAAAVLIKRKK